MNPIYLFRRVSGKVFYGWLVVAISLVIMTASYTALYSWPLFYVSILDEFGWSRAGTALIFSVAGMVYAFSSPISGALFDRLGPRKLFTIGAIFLVAGVIGCSRAYEFWQFCIFFGLLVALGLAATGITPNVALVSGWFEKKRATAVGISVIGTRDTFLLAPLIQLLIIALGWRNTYLVLAVFAAIIIPLAQFLRAKPQEMGLLPDGVPKVEEENIAEPSKIDSRIVDREWASTEWTLKKAIKKYQYWALFLMMLGTGFAFSALINHFVVLMIDIGFDALFAAKLLLFYAIATMIARACGFVSDLIGREITCTIGLTLVLFSLVILLTTEDTSTPSMLYIAITCFGFGSGMHVPTYAAGIADLFQGKKFGSIFGFAYGGYGLSASINTWLFGYIFDVTGTYTLAIIITIFAVVMMIIAMWVAAPRKVRRVGRRAYKIP